MTHPEPWPLRHLVLRTPRLELRPDDDAGLLELAEEAQHGVHPPEEMPFSVPWTDADPRDLGRGTLQFFWRQRARCEPQDWTVNFLVRSEGRVVGMQGLVGHGFRTVGEVETGSWIGLRHQGRGIGTEMRAAVLAFAFDHLGALRARSGAFTDNTASRRVSAPSASAVTSVGRKATNTVPVDERAIGSTEPRPRLVTNGLRLRCQWITVGPRLLHTERSAV